MEASERLKILRKELKITQNDFSKKLGISRSFLAQMEDGTIGISRNFLTKLLATFNVSLDWLFTGKGDMFIPDNSDPRVDQFKKFLEQASPEDIESVKLIIERLSEKYK